jgi:hypothetical protein
MLRKTTCAVAGVALACAAAFSLSHIAHSDSLEDLDLRWLHAAKKGDRLSSPATSGDHAVVSFDMSSQRVTIVTRKPVSNIVESAVQTPRPTVRTISVHPVREVPNGAKRERLPTGCEPAFSPVTNPDYAHIGVRCDS